MAVLIDGEKQTYSYSKWQRTIATINDAVISMYPTRGIDSACEQSILNAVRSMYHRKTVFSMTDVYDRIVDLLTTDGCAEAARIAAKVTGGLRILEAVQKTNDHLWTHILCEDASRLNNSVGERKRQALQAIDIDLAKRMIWTPDIVQAYECGDLYFSGMAESVYGGVGDLYVDLSTIVKSSKCFSAACRSIAEIAKETEFVQFGAWHIDLQQLAPAVKASVSYYAGCKKQVMWDDLHRGLQDLLGIRQKKVIQLTGSTQFIDAVLNYYTKIENEYTASSAKFIFPIKISATTQSKQDNKNLELAVKYALKGVHIQFGRDCVYQQTYKGEVVSSRIVLNLGAAAVEAHESIPNFWNLLERRFEICGDIIMKQVHLFQSMPEISCPALLDSGIMQKHMVEAEICVIGLAECSHHFIGKPHCDAEALPFIEDIAKKLRSNCKTIARKAGISVKLTDDCDHAVNELLTRATRERCGDRFLAFRKDRLSCGIQLSSQEPISAFAKIETEGFCADCIDDVMSTQLVIPDLSQNIPAILSLIYYACSFDLKIQLKIAEAGEEQHLQRTVGN